MNTFIKKFGLIIIATLVLFLYNTPKALASITLSDPDNTNAPNLAITLTITSPDTIGTGVVPTLTYYDLTGGSGAPVTNVAFTDMTGGVWKASFSFTCTTSTTSYKYFAQFGTYTSDSKDLCTEGVAGGQQNPASGDPGGQQNPQSGDPGGQQNGPQGVLTNPINVGTLTEFIAKILDIVLTIGFPIIALAIIYAGFLFVTAQGNSEKLETAKKTLLYTIIGAAILLGSWIIASAIGGTITLLKG